MQYKFISLEPILMVTPMAVFAFGFQHPALSPWVRAWFPVVTFMGHERRQL